MMKNGLLLLFSFAMILSDNAFCAPTPVINISIPVSDLSKPVEILRDHWGIDHIYAETENDLFFAQGYSAARNRLFQLEIWRMQASGTAAESFGRREIKRDIAARLLRYRGERKKELNHYHPRGDSIINAFVRGINAYISETERAPELLPIEFRLLGIKPRRWTADIVISRHQGLFYNATGEVALARITAVLGKDKLRRLWLFQGGEPNLTTDPIIDLKAIPENVMELYSAFRAPIAFTPEQIVTEQRNDPDSYKKLVAQSVAASGPSVFSGPNNYVGSNNWVIQGSRTVGGHPIMANDPHRGIVAPSLRYWVHLVGPGWNVIGAGEPALPGVSIGHNEHGAWGLTIFGNDFEDLYVYETNPNDTNEYRFRGRWERMRVVQDSIQVKGETAPVHVEYKFTRHGPVLFEDKGRRKAYALRAAWMDVGGAPYLSSLRMDQSRDWQEFREACTFNYTPSESMVWADRHGNIGFQATGLQPIRRNWGGLLPVPGDGRYEWDGYLPIKDLPNEHNPARGYIATANNYLFPIDYRFPEAIHLLWNDAYRYARISEVLSSGRLFNVAEVMRLQNDQLSIPARQLIPLLAELPLSGPSAAARDVIAKWDLVLDKDSVAASIYTAWERRLVQRFRELVLTDENQRALSINPYLSRVIDQLAAPDGIFGDSPTTGRDQLLIRSFDEAIAELTSRYGPDMHAWRYGEQKSQQVTIKHPLSSAVNPEMRKRLDIGTAARGGNEQTVNFLLSPSNAATASGNSTPYMGGTTKIIVDTAMWDRSVGQHTPGQSGNPDSPYYRDLFEMWTQGKYFPLLYSREMVESSTDERLLLAPESALLSQ